MKIGITFPMPWVGFLRPIMKNSTAAVLSIHRNHLLSEAVTCLFLPFYAGNPWNRSQVGKAL